MADQNINITITQSQQKISLIMQTLLGAIVTKGDTGLSAYELAILAGFEGTLSQWLQSLKGEQLSVNSESFNLTSTDILNKYVTLTATVKDNQSVMVFIDNSGLIAEVGVDYSVSGQEIYWIGYNFQSLLAEGDKLRVIYN